MREFKDWYVWLTSHPKAGEFLLSHFTHSFVGCDIGNIDPKMAVVTLRLDQLSLGAEAKAAWIKRKLTREKCERILAELGWNDFIDRRSLKGGDLGFYNSETHEEVATFEGGSRWEAALQWALQEWERGQ